MIFNRPQEEHKHDTKDDVAIVTSVAFLFETYTIRGLVMKGLSDIVEHCTFSYNTVNPIPPDLSPELLTLVQAVQIEHSKYVVYHNSITELIAWQKSYVTNFLVHEFQHFRRHSLHTLYDNLILRHNMWSGYLRGKELTKEQLYGLDSASKQMKAFLDLCSYDAEKDGDYATWLAHLVNECKEKMLVEQTRIEEHPHRKPSRDRHYNVYCIHGRCYNYYNYSIERMLPALDAILEWCALNKKEGLGEKKM